MADGFRGRWASKKQVWDRDVFHESILFIFGLRTTALQAKFIINEVISIHLTEYRLCEKAKGRSNYLTCIKEGQEERIIKIWKDQL